ncbi:MAG: hypothetical protein AB7R69_05055 [Candidatus Babeliales bacterium]
MKSLQYLVIMVGFIFLQSFCMEPESVAMQERESRHNPDDLEKYFNSFNLARKAQSTLCSKIGCFPTARQISNVPLLACFMTSNLEKHVQKIINQKNK